MWPRATVSNASKFDPDSSGGVTGFGGEHVRGGGVLAWRALVSAPKRHARPRIGGGSGSAFSLVSLAPARLIGSQMEFTG